MAAPFNAAWWIDSLLDNRKRARHLFVAAATENVASECELTCLVGCKAEACDRARFHVPANPKVRQVEPVSHILRCHFKDYYFTLFRLDLTGRELKLLCSQMYDPFAGAGARNRFVECDDS